MIRRKLLLVISTVLVSAAFLPLGSGTAQAIPPIPSSMSGIGDSITRAFNACGWYVECTSRSWSAGSYSPINSHYNRILAKNSAINGKNYNDAVSGAEAIDLNAQAINAGNRSVQYVTILIGANDACASTEAGMTAVSTFRSQIDTALNTLKSKIPNAAIFIASIPDLKRLWYIGHHDFYALSAWDGYDICQSMLVNATSHTTSNEDRRNRVRQRVIDYNTQLAQACTAYGANCKFDNNAAFNYQFVLSQVSSWDYFHPNESGQKVVADVTYKAGFNW